MARRRRPNRQYRPGLDDPRYWAMREQLKRLQQPCGHCGYPIDMQLKYPHPLSWSCDHIIPRSRLTPNDPRNWDLTNARAAHFRCNSARGNKPIVGHVHPLDTSIDW